MYTVGLTPTSRGLSLISPLSLKFLIRLELYLVCYEGCLLNNQNIIKASCSSVAFQRARRRSCQRIALVTQYVQVTFSPKGKNTSSGRTNVSNSWNLVAESDTAEDQESWAARSTSASPWARQRWSWSVCDHFNPISYPHGNVRADVFISYCKTHNQNISPGGCCYLLIIVGH